jgi:hypothetical protein
MGSRPGTLLVLLVFCLFMGVTAIAMGLGAAIPSINHVARPLVCPNGTMEVEGQVYRPYPGKTVVSQTWYCADSQSSARTKIGMFPMVLYSGTVYGLALFGLLFLLITLRRGSNGRNGA